MKISAIMRKEVKNLKQRGISQEGLKLIACVTMLIDHIGAVFVYAYYRQQSMAQGMHMVALWNVYMAHRIIGRIAFPIFCFLLVEGMFHTHNRNHYCRRMVLGAILSEIPFNLAFSGTILDTASTNVMVTLLLGLLMMVAMEKVPSFWKIPVIFPFYYLAELFQTDYAGHGILLVAMLALTRGLHWEMPLRVLSFPALLWFGADISFGSVRFPIELFALLGLPFLLCYSGKKRTYNKAVQWLFYFFYPVHLLVLWLIKGLLFGW